MSDPIGSAARLRDCPGFLRFWTAATVSGFGTYVRLACTLIHHRVRN